MTAMPTTGEKLKHDAHALLAATHAYLMIEARRALPASLMEKHQLTALGLVRITRQVGLRPQEEKTCHLLRKRASYIS